LRIIYIHCACNSESLFIDVFIGVQESKKKVLENGGYLLKVERRIKAKKFQRTAGANPQKTAAC
jgi:hypothetical protein